MTDLSRILDHAWPGCFLRVRRWKALYGESTDPDMPPPLIEKIDMWATIENDETAMQAALDWGVDWAPNITPPAAAEVIAAIAAAEAEMAAARLENRRAAALAETDRQAEMARLRFITPGAGQALAYEAKRREAEAWAAETAAGAAPDPAAYPWARSRAAMLGGIAGTDVTAAQCQGVVDEWAARVDAWRAAGVEIEAVREAAKLAIGAAPDEASIDAVIAGLLWPEPSSK